MKNLKEWKKVLKIEIYQIEKQKIDFGDEGCIKYASYKNLLNNF